MSVAYVDTSAIAALVFVEPSAPAVSDCLSAFSKLISSNLLEAELRSACHRERRPVPDRLLAQVTWVQSERRLSSEMEVALAVGYLRGGDLWHVATALFVAAAQPEEIAFVTLDRRQAAVAAALGFRDGGIIGRD